MATEELPVPFASHSCRILVSADSRTLQRSAALTGFGRKSQITGDWKSLWRSCEHRVAVDGVANATELLTHLKPHFRHCGLIGVAGVGIGYLSLCLRKLCLGQFHDAAQPDLVSRL